MPWKTSTKASDGATYRYFYQLRGGGCGPAAVATAAKYIHKKEYGISTVSEYFKFGEGVEHVTREHIRDFQNYGSWYGGVAASLEKLKIDGVPYQKNAAIFKFINKVTPLTPAILSVGWYDYFNGQYRRNGGHWVVALKIYNNDVICLDPALDQTTVSTTKKVRGIVEIPMDDFEDMMQFGTNMNYPVDYGSGQESGIVDGMILCSKAIKQSKSSYSGTSPKRVALPGMVQV